MVRTEVHTTLDQELLDEILALIDEATRIEGHRPVGEHKYAHLAVGAAAWAGVLARRDGRLVGYAHTRWNAAGQRPRMAVEVAVHPQFAEGGAVAHRLLEEARALLAASGGGLLFLWVHRVEDPRTTLAARMGLSIERELAFMSRRLDARPDVPPLPGVEIRPYRPGIDDDEFLRVNNVAFAGHPENGGWDHDEFARRRGYDWFDPEGLLMAWRDGQLLGFHWTKWHAHDSDEVPAHEPVGEVYVLAVDPAIQGLGLGRTLLAAGLEHLWARGCRLAVLYVDRSSEDAVRLYEAAGFSLEYLEVCYEERVPAVSRPADDLSRPI
jgi:mycothiol synthase